jgi:hypothetical protein
MTYVCFKKCIQVQWSDDLTTEVSENMLIQIHAELVILFSVYN